MRTRGETAFPKKAHGRGLPRIKEGWRIRKESRTVMTLLRTWVRSGFPLLYNPITVSTEFIGYDVNLFYNSIPSLVSVSLWFLSKNQNDHI